MAHPRTPETHSGLLARLAALARFSERSQPSPQRQAALEQSLRRLMLGARMAERLGIAAPDTPLLRAVLREVALGCVDCTEWRRCRQWLDAGAANDEYRDFCPNEGLLGVLPRREEAARRDPG